MSDYKLTILSLDKPLIIEILSFLPVREYCNISKVSSLFHECCKSDYLYRKACNYLLPYVSSQFYSEFQANVSRFARISNAFFKILSLFESKNAVQLYKSLKMRSNPKVSEIINNYHCELDPSNLCNKSSFFSLPENCINEELYWAYLLYNGQGLSFPGFFGSYEFYDVYVSLSYLSKNQVINPNVISVSGEGRERIILFVDSKNTFKNGDRAIYCTTGFHAVLYLSPSFTDFLESYRDKLLSNKLKIVEGKVLLYEYNEYSSVNSEYGIKITATALFIPHLSENRRFLWSYLVTIEEDNPERSWKLTTRTWRIQDSNGEVQTVDRQPGVIGLYPKVFKGCEPTQYTSCCYLKTVSGVMSGFFTFRDTQNSQTVDVQIPAFRLEIPLGSRLINTA